MMLHTVLTAVQVLCCLAIIGLVLIQRGKGADAGAGFGAGASGTVFGARGASTALSRATAIFAAVFMINSLLLAYLGQKVSTDQPKTLLDEGAAGRRPVPVTGGNTPVPISPGAPASGTPAPATSGAPAEPVPSPTAPAGGTTSSQAPPAAAPAPAVPAK